MAGVLDLANKALTLSNVSLEIRILQTRIGD